MVTTRMSCPGCRVAVEASFPASRLGELSLEHQRFIEMFVLASGSLKEIARHVGVSYPTVRSRLDRVIETLRLRIAQDRELGGTILDAAGGEGTTAEDAARLIKKI